MILPTTARRAQTRLHKIDVELLCIRYQNPPRWLVLLMLLKAYIFVLEVLKLRMDPDLRYQLPVTVEQQIFQVNYIDYFAVADQNLQKDS